MSEAPCPFCGQIHGTACNGLATTPANPTDQIEAVVATPAVVQDAQQYDWRDDYLHNIPWCPSLDRLVAHVEGLEARRILSVAHIERLEAERDALRLRMDEMSRMVDAGLQVSAERVIRGE